MAVNFSVDQTLGIMNNLGNSLKETYDIIGAEKAFKEAMDFSLQNAERHGKVDLNSLFNFIKVYETDEIIHIFSPKLKFQLIFYFMCAAVNKARRTRCFWNESESLHDHLMQRWGESCNIFHRMKEAEKKDVKYKGSFSTTILPYDTTLMAVSQRASLRAARFQVRCRFEFSYFHLVSDWSLCHYLFRSHWRRKP